MPVSAAYSQITFDALRKTATSTGSDLAEDTPACIVAKVAAIGPPSFHMDITLLENRFEFKRIFKELGPPPPHAPGGSE